MPSPGSVLHAFQRQETGNLAATRHDFKAFRRFAGNGADPPPKWSDFADPLDAISGRFGHIREQAKPSRFTKPEQRALSVLGLGEDADRHSLRQRYSNLVRRYHPDKNGGDRSHERRLGEVIESYQLLRKSAAFA